MSGRVDFYSKDFELSDSIRSYVTDKLRPIINHLGEGEVLEVRVDLSRDHHHRKGEVFRAEVNLRIPKQLLRVVEFGENMPAAVDLMEERLKRLAERYKGRQAARQRRVAKVKRMLKLFTFRNGS